MWIAYYRTLYRVNQLDFIHFDEAMRYAARYGFLSVMEYTEGVAVERHFVKEGK